MSDPKTLMPAQEAVEIAAARLLIELAFLVPKGTDFRGELGKKLMAYRNAVEARMQSRIDALTAEVQALLKLPHELRQEQRADLDRWNAANAEAHATIDSLTAEVAAARVNALDEAIALTEMQEIAWSAVHSVVPGALAGLRRSLEALREAPLSKEPT